MDSTLTLSIWSEAKEQYTIHLNNTPHIPLKNGVFNYWQTLIFCDLLSRRAEAVKVFPVIFERPDEILSLLLLFHSWDVDENFSE